VWHPMGRGRDRGAAGPPGGKPPLQAGATCRRPIGCHTDEDGGVEEGSVSGERARRVGHATTTDMPDRPQINLAIVELILRERVNADRLRLALRVAIAPTAIATLWPPTGHAEAAARWVAAILLGEEPREA